MPSPEVLREGGIIVLLSANYMEKQFKNLYEAPETIVMEIRMAAGILTLSNQQAVASASMNVSFEEEDWNETE